MRSTLEDALILYRQEIENLIFVAAPAIVVGPILVLVIAASGLLTGLIAVALIGMLYAVVYAACVSGAALIHTNEDPDPVSAYVWTLRRAITTLQSAGPGIAGLIVTLEAAYLIAHFGYPGPAFLLGILAIGLGIFWASKHAIEQPMTVAFGATLEEAREFAEDLSAGQGVRGMTFYVLVALPVIAGAVLCLAIASLNPVFGAAVLAAIVALWLPFCALAITGAGARWLHEVSATPSRASAWERR